MSRFAHRQPAWGTISVVLLSALFLSPLTGASLLHALALDASWRLANASHVASEDTAPAAPQQSPKEHSAPQQTPSTTPRRTPEEDEAALRRAAAALRGQIRNLRLHTDPTASDMGSGDTLVVYLPTRTVLLVPDIGAVEGIRRPLSGEALPSRVAARSLSPRAPPVA